VTYTIAAFYRFVRIAEPTVLREQLLASFRDGDLLGTTLIANEGVNGTVAGSAATIDRFLQFLADRVGLDLGDVKFSFSEQPPFKRLKFKLKAEIITFRDVVIDPTKPGQYVAPPQWNALIADPDVLVLDTRNTYESEAGTFEGAITPELEKFSDFVSYVRENLDAEKHRRVAMFCTGGIRCEKASAFMLQEGFAEVYHLKGGILKYLEQTPQHESRWQGGCYVFDRRTSVDHETFETKR
jgi:Predicted sulfurtransferase